MIGVGPGGASARVHPQPRRPGPALAVITPLHVSRVALVRGQGLSATVTVRNPGPHVLVLRDLVLWLRRPAAGRQQGLETVLRAAGHLTLAPRKSFTLSAARTFTGRDPLGRYTVYLSYSAADRVRHDVAPRRMVDLRRG